MNIKDNITTLNQFSDREGYNIKGIVIHSMWGNYSGSIQWFQNPKAKASAHYCIRSDGEITKCVEESAAAWQSGNVTVSKSKAPKLIQDNWGINPNFITIGIELEDKRDKNRVYPELQRLACAELVADICKRYAIQPSRDTILMHKEIDPINRSDPVGKWDQDLLIADVVNFIRNGNEQPIAEDKRVVKITSVFGANIRNGSSKIFKVLRVEKKNATIEVSGYVEGETIKGNNLWWVTSNKEYLWSGTTDQVPNLSKGDSMDLEAKKVELVEERKKLEDAQLAIEESFKKLTQAEQAWKEAWESQVVVEVKPVEEVKVEEPVAETPVDVAQDEKINKLEKMYEELKALLGK